MNRFVLIVCILSLSIPNLHAYDDTEALSSEEVRLQRFWHDYYDSLSRYYKSLDSIDWVAYYKNHGYAINCGPAGCGRVQFAPVFVSPTMQWAAPSGIPQPPPGLTLPATAGEQKPATKKQNPTAAGTMVSAPLARDERSSVRFRHRAVRLSSNEQECTHQLNELAADGWEYVGPLGNGMTAFKRSESLH